MTLLVAEKGFLVINEDTIMFVSMTSWGCNLNCVKACS